VEGRKHRVLGRQTDGCQALQGSRLRRQD
jgi:hypothetical protein